MGFLAHSPAAAIRLSKRVFSVPEVLREKVGLFSKAV
jgi:hypothetical protein